MITENLNDIEIQVTQRSRAMIRHILFPTDFSDMAKATEPYVSRFAAHFGSRVTTLHVIDLPAAFYGMSAGYVVENTEVSTLQERAREAMQAVLAGTDAEREVRLGDAASVIAHFAEANAVDLIMMPTHGYGPFRRALLGSVTANVLHSAKCAVWTMAHSDQAGVGACLDPKRILCAIDLVPESVQVIQKADELARSLGAQVSVAHVVPQAHRNGLHGHGEAVGQRGLERQNFYTDHARQEIARIQAAAGTEFGVYVDAGPVAATIAEMARKNQASLVITGRGAVEHFLGTVRSHAYPIIYESACPVLSL
jgi:nucleotide-binding universal stress UspA family protein